MRNNSNNTHSHFKLPYVFSLLILKASRIGFLILMIFASFAKGQVTLEFQDGLSPTITYWGTKDASLSEENPTNNYGQENELLIDGDNPHESGLDKYALIKWDLSSIPLNSTVQAVDMTLTVTNKSKNSYELYEIKKDWVEDQTTWNSVDGLNPWQVAGANGPNDRGTDVLATLAAPTTGVYTISLNAAGLAVVQSWVDNPTSNFGFILASSTSADGINISSSESDTPNDRPLLSVTYLDSGEPPNIPPTVSISNPANGSTFTAGENIILSVNAFDADGYVALVEFFNGPTKLGEDDSSPYEFSWNNIPAGNQNLTAKATDNSGATSSSNSVSIIVQSEDGQIILEFQDGVSPSLTYLGTRDASLNEDNPTSNYGQANDLLIDGDNPPNSGLDKYALIKWDLSSIPLTSTVESVDMTINVTNKSKNSYELYEIKKDWVEDQTTWNSVDGLNPWQVAGANGPDDKGTDVLATLAAPTTGVYTISLNAAGLALVQSWVNNPASNFGFIFASQTSPDGIDFSSSETYTPNNRPLLSVLVNNSSQSSGPEGTESMSTNIGINSAITASVEKSGGNNIVLNWFLESTLDSGQFIIEHSRQNGESEEILVISKNVQNSQGAYSYTLAGLVPDKHFFRLRQTNGDGLSVYSNEVETFVSSSDEYELSAAFPNPFNASTEFTLLVTQEQHIKIEFYNILGHLVNVLFDDTLQENRVKTFQIDGRFLPTGIYFYRVTGKTFTTTRKLLLSK